MAPLAWVRRVAAEVPELNEIPLFGKAPPFDWSAFSSSVKARFSISLLSLRVDESLWREPMESGKWLGTDLLTLPIAPSPLGTCFWIMSRPDMIKLTSWMMKSGKKAAALSSEILQEGFYRYLALEALDVLQGMAPFKELTLQLSEEELPSERTFCIDVELEFEGKSCWGRLAIPEGFRSAWVRHFSHMPSVYTSTETARQVQIVVGVKTGSLTLRREEWDTIQAGDFVLLDQGSYDPHKGTGIASLMLQKTSLFNAKIKQNKIELTDYAFYHEESMEHKGSPEHIAKEEAVALKELPLCVTVEIARFKMTLDQLMHLTPGNTLDLPVHPDQNVSLTINGQKVGSAELVYLGEQLGLRILEI